MTKNTVREAILTKLYLDPTKTVVPKAPDRKALEALAVEIVDQTLKEERV